MWGWSKSELQDLSCSLWNLSLLDKYSSPFTWKGSLLFSQCICLPPTLGCICSVFPKVLFSNKTLRGQTFLCPFLNSFSWQDQGPISDNMLIQCRKSTKWCSSSFNFQFSGILFLVPDGSIPPMGTKISQWEELRFFRAGSNNSVVSY